MMSNKRSRAETNQESIAVTMAKCLMLLSRDNREIDYGSVINQQQTRTSPSTKDRVYGCKTCNKQFPSFQAVIRHRASHKTRPVMDLYSSDNQSLKQKTKKPKMHECSICGLKFEIGQALGGHMRRHRAATIESSLATTETATATATATTGLSSSSSSDITTSAPHLKELVPQVPVLKRSNNRRVLSLNLDLDLDLSLSLHPLDNNNDLEFSIDVKAAGKHISTASTIYKNMMSNNKRSRGEMKESMAATMAKCFMLLSRDNGEIDYRSAIAKQRMPTTTPNRVFECKTCNKQFPSFQALGGHRASHKKPRLMELYSSDNQSISDNQQQAKKPKMHECSICGLTFAIGQALGGHMRRHRAAMIESSITAATTALTTTGLSSSLSDNTDISFEEEVVPQVPVLKRSNSSRSNKRNRGEMEEMSIENMAKFLMILSSDRGEVYDHPVIQQQTRLISSRKRVFECKTCNRQFPSFQALGGHRGSHKKLRLINQIGLLTKPKLHECSICGLEFSVGQALGGHMRKHRAVTAPAAMATTGLSSPSSDITTHKKQPPVPVVKRSNSKGLLSLNLNLDLNNLPTTAMESNDFEFSTLVAPHKQISVPPMIYSFI
ncbi:hypothetical protein MKX01_004113 [Papaver californicum]|nr:hypothetical protein MKX01_004113 [Papaver californicum]